MTRLHDLTAAAQLRALRSREISSRELTQHYLDRIDRHAHGLGAFATVSADVALREAEEADRLLSEGASGPLTGLPIAIKDLQATEGVPTSAGSRALIGFVPAEDAWAVGGIRRAGAVLLGKSTASEFGATCYTDDEIAGAPAVTPYDTGRYASGSSSGAAIAVAAGLASVAHGSDGAGSIRTPAATANLVGVKPSRGLVSSAPATAFLATTIEGPLARTVEDAALLLDVMAQPWSGDIYAWRASASFADAARDGEVRPLRIITWSESGLERMPIDPSLVRAVRRTAEMLRGMGHEIREVPVPARLDPPVVDALRTWLTSSVGFAVDAVVPAGRRDLVSPLTAHLTARAAELSAADVLTAQSVLARYASTFLEAFEDADAALTPTTAAPPVRVGHFLEDGLDQVLDRMLDWSCPTPWVNLTGQPAVSLPAGFDEAGLPLGVQLIGRPRADAGLLALAAQVEAAAPHHQTHPPVWSE
ncbi:amidase [Microbacterium sp. NPDC058342]|uniref:amidase n=1 Tax=Microbacterium sp. NPDC058342 TaxID=3346454 RepID=UPI00364A01C8